MHISEDLKKIIDDDIVKCETAISKGNNDSRWELHSTLLSKYGKIIDGFGEHLLSLLYDDDGTCKKRNLETMKQKLELFKAMGYVNSYSQQSGGITVNTNVSTSVNVTVESVKDQIEKMTSLRDEEIVEIHEKIDELEKILASNDRKTKKWEKAKGIIKWIADKGVDVGIAMLPLLMQIGQ